MNILNLTPQQLKQAARIKEKIADLESDLVKLFGSVGKDVSSSLIRKGKRKMSEAGRLAIIAAQKLRWSKVRGKAKPETRKRKMSAVAKAKIAAAAKARWKRAKAAGKSRL
jgi:hypothetical protein